MPLPKSKDPILVELEAICKNRLAIPTSFIHANLRESNFDLDNLTGVEFPVLVYVATTKNREKVNEAGHIIRKAHVICMVLNRQEKDADTSAFKSYDLNESINQMRQLGENLMYWINKSSISVNGGIDEWNSDDVYQEFDAHLFGQAIEFDWSIDTRTSGYYNNPG